MRLAHVIITRFSFRGGDAMAHIAGPTWVTPTDPLEPDRLRRRLRLFRIVCLPSLRAQRERDFRWVVIVDRDLPDPIREELAGLLAPLENAHLHAYWPGDRLETSAWFERFLTEAPDLLVTTNLDEDDGLPIDFVGAVRGHVADLALRGVVPVVGIAGVRQIAQWDLVSCAEAPRGWRSPWHRRDHPSSCGFSLLCAYPRYRFSVLALEHIHAHRYLALETAAEVDNVRHVRRMWFDGDRAGDADLLRRWRGGASFHDLGTATGPVLMTNHADNDQRARLHESKDTRRAVTGPETFPNVRIDWQALASADGVFVDADAAAPTP